MAYTIKARFYNSPDQFGESYVITSDNTEEDTNLEVGSKISIYGIGVEPSTGADHNYRAKTQYRVGRLSYIVIER